MKLSKYIPNWFKISTATGKLIKDLKAENQFIYTTNGIYKKRKNGRTILKVGEEIIRCTLVS